MAIGSFLRAAPGPRSAIGALAGVRDDIRRNPFTAGYLVLIGIGLLVVGHLLPAAAADRFKTAISTNPHNMAHDPVGVLLVSPLVSATDSSLLSYFFVIGIGVGVCLAALERRVGTLRALAALVLGNAAATAVATGVAAAAVHSGRYPANWWDGKDYGISYAVFTVAGAVTPLVRLRWRPVWLTVVCAYPFVDARWFGDLPNFGTIGHLTAIGLGLVAGFVMPGSRSSGSEVTNHDPAASPSLPAPPRQSTAAAAQPHPAEPDPPPPSR